MGDQVTDMFSVVRIILRWNRFYGRQFTIQLVLQIYKTIARRPGWMAGWLVKLSWCFQWLHVPRRRHGTQPTVMCDGHISRHLSQREENVTLCGLNDRLLIFILAITDT